MAFDRELVLEACGLRSTPFTRQASVRRFYSYWLEKAGLKTLKDVKGMDARRQNGQAVRQRGSRAMEMQ